MQKAILAAIAVVVVGGLLVLGRGTNTKTNEQDKSKVSITASQSSGTGEQTTQVNIGASGVSVTGSASGTGSTGTATVGTNVSLPADFPADVPTPAGNLITAYGGREGKAASFGLSYAITGPGAANAAADYQNKLRAAGFTIDAAGSVAAALTNVTGFTATKGTWNVAVAVTAGADTTNLTLTVTEETTE